MTALARSTSDLLMFLLDTNIVSEWTKPKPSSRVVAWLDAQAETGLFLSVVAFAELRRGIPLLASAIRPVSRCIHVL